MLSQDGIFIYPEMYVLKDGYANFFRNHPDLCEPRFHLVRERCVCVCEEERVCVSVLVC